MCIHQRHHWALSQKMGVLARVTGAEKCVCWRKLLWWCWWWDQQMWASVQAGPQLPVLLDLETSIIKMAIAFQFQDVYTDLGGVKQRIPKWRGNACCFGLCVKQTLMAHHVSLW